MKWRWGKEAVEGNAKVSELMVVPLTEVRDPTKELVWGRRGVCEGSLGH